MYTLAKAYGSQDGNDSEEDEEGRGRSIVRSGGERTRAHGGSGFGRGGGRKSGDSSGAGSPFNSLIAYPRHNNIVVVVGGCKGHRF